MDNEPARKNSKLKQFLDDINTDYKQAVDEVNHSNKSNYEDETIDDAIYEDDYDEDEDFENADLYSNSTNNKNLLNDLKEFESIEETITPLNVVPKKSNFETVIAKNTTIKGTVFSDDSIEISGKVIGDIECKQDMLINGRIKGTTSSQNAQVVDAVVDGALNCSGELFVNHNSWVVGNLKSFDAEVNGKIKGNINTRDTLLVGHDAIVMGDISTGELEIKKGAFVNGKINMYQASKEIIDTFENLVEE